ncbi:MAG TPA: glycosyltransferase family 39 protein, partial [Aggregatilineales bacterium]|nr:glycosyltransferase family 39 protein [Aggregatilineales bacterium]
MLYLNFQSLSLDDFDSGSFALALNHFDIALQQPHPPGFPVYVGMGHLALALTGQPRTAMTLLSALMGTVAVVSLTWLGAEMGSWPGGLLAGLLLAFLPGFWLSAEMALSDVPGLALILLAVACLCRARRLSDLRWLAAGVFLGGLCLGLRPQDGIPVAIFGLYAVALSRGLKPPAQLVLAVVAALVGIALWFIPTVIATGGIGTYFDLLRTHSAHVLQIDSLFAQPVTLQNVALRLSDFGSGLLALVGGSPIVALAALLVVGIGLLRVRWRSAEALLLAAWLAIVAVQVFLLESLARPRLYLPFVPPLLLLAAMGWVPSTLNPSPTKGGGTVRRLPIPFPHEAGRGRGWGAILLNLPLFLAGAFALTSLPLAAILAQQPTPPAQATAFIAAQYPPDKTLVVTMGSLRAAQIDLPNYAQLYL